MESLDFVADAVRSLLHRLPPGAHDGVAERTKTEIEQDDDYGVDWDISASPTNPLACPIDLFASLGSSGECSWGFAFDTRGRVAANLGLKLGQRTRHIVAFGTEPIRMQSHRVVSIIEAVVQGQVELRYRALARRLTQTAGAVLVPGAPQRFRGYGLPLGGRKILRYAAWTQAG